MVLWKVSLRRFPWNHGKVLTKKIRPRNCSRGPIRTARGTSARAAILIYIIAAIAPVKLRERFAGLGVSFADAIGGSGGRLKKRTRRRASADWNAEPDRAPALQNRNSAPPVLRDLREDAERPGHLDRGRRRGPRNSSIVPLRVSVGSLMPLRKSPQRDLAHIVNAALA
jgi:hypothetical protein